MSSFQLKQIPAAGEYRKFYAGDVLHVELLVEGAEGGIGELRTNLGRRRLHLNRVVRERDMGCEGRSSAEEWHDVGMRSLGHGRFVCDLPLSEVGTYMVKCHYRARVGGGRHWVSGNNLRIRVEPACTVACNTIYNAFVRQFGPNRSGGWHAPELAEGESILDGRGYTVLPPSGHFRDLLREIPFLIDDLGFRVIQLLPIQPTPTSYGRMGRYGSPFAPTDYFGIDPALAEFDRRCTPLDQFRELVDCIHGHGGMVLLDLPIDHTGWASRLQQEHPEWFCRESDGSFASPGAWGVVWEDLCKLDFAHHGLWDYLADVFLHWVRQGVDGFRCDAGYMIPRPVWRHIVSRVRSDYPDVVFFLEGLGGTVECTHDLLENGGMNWAYTELFQVVGQQWVKNYLGRLFSGLSQRGVWVNFAETHDNNRLAATGRRWAEMRTALSALTSDHGAFGMANGVEWLATEKIDVHGSASLNWGAPENLVSYIGTLNRILRWHPAFGKGSLCRLVGSGDAVGVLREGGSHRVLAVFNVDEHEAAAFSWPESLFGLGECSVDLLTGARPRVSASPEGGRLELRLLPGESLCLSDHDLGWWEAHGEDANALQCLEAVALQAWVQLRGYGDMAGCTLETLTGALRQGGRHLVSVLTGGAYAPVVGWDPACDEHRVVTVPAGHFLSIRCSHPFRASLEPADRPSALSSSFRTDAGVYEMLLCSPRSLDGGRERWVVRMEEFDGDRVIRRQGVILMMPAEGNPPVSLRVSGAALTPQVTGICTNEFGGYALVRGRWGDLRSKYDALLAAGLSGDCPVDRRIGLSRCRGWLVYRDASVELSPEFQDWFGSGYEGLMGWGFTVPLGFDATVRLEVTYQFSRTGNGGRLVFRRLDSGGGLDGGEPLALVLRPDVDWRVNHEETRAYMGAEHAFPQGVTAFSGGFRFAPHGSEGLWMRTGQGTFDVSGEWQYQLELPEDLSRGLPGKTDVFSPGYFRMALPAGAACAVELGTGKAPGVASEAPRRPADAFSPRLLGDCLRRSLDLYVARRDENRTVIAGYPWFLDWGRDTLICLRGLVAAGDLAGSRDIIRAFASFEVGGTIPNMIRGRDSGDRATSDAPLWLLVAAEDLFRASGEAGEELMEMDCGGRPLKAILESVVRHYADRVSNGIQGDPETGLVFSPSHYTWMDTNYPAGTPREGYPVEIQALWIHGLGFVSEITGRGWYADRLRLAERSFLELFVRGDGQGLCDCLHGHRGMGARACQADDAIRPNQLLAVTLCDFLPRAVAESVLKVCEGLLLPGSIRSLADRGVSYGQPVVRDGVLLNDPHRPYQGRYAGDEDRCRKAAYHNGTGWGWQFPLYCEALYGLWGRSGLGAARSLLASVVEPMESNCIGHIPEICDGDAPHLCRGCPAQAWSMFESYRVWRKLNEA